MAQKSDPAVKVGIMTLIVGIVLAGLIIWKEGVFSNVGNYKIYGVFGSVAGLLEGAEVRFRGFDVGHVHSIEPGPATAKVTLLIKPKTKIPFGAALRISFDGLIGQKFIEIILPETGVDQTRTIAPNSILPGTASAGITDFIEVGVANLEELKHIITSVRELATDPMIKLSIKESIINVQIASNNLAELFNKLNTALAGREGEISATLDNLSRISKVLDKSLANIGQFLADPALVDDLNSVRTSVKNTAQNLADITARLDEMLASPDTKGSVMSMAQAAQKTFNSVNDFLQKVNSFDFKAYTDLLYAPKQNNIYYKINADVQFTPEHYYHAAVGGGMGKEGIELKDLEFGKHFQSLDLKIGLYNRDLGGGLTLYPWLPGLAISADAYNPNEVKVDIGGTYRVWNDFYLEGKIFTVNDNASRKYYGGVKIAH